MYPQKNRKVLIGLFHNNDLLSFQSFAIKMFDIQTRQTCSSNVNWSMRVGDHTVKYGPSYGDYAYNYHCDCKSFKFRKKCSHIETAKDHRCGWGIEAFCGDFTVSNDGLCPSCGKETQVIKVAV